MATEAEMMKQQMELEMRNANTDDVDDIADVMCAALPADPQWAYRFPRYREYPEDTLECTRRMYHRFLKDRGGTESTLVKVVTDRGLMDTAASSKPIAVAVWKLEYHRHLPT